MTIDHVSATLVTIAMKIKRSQKIILTVGCLSALTVFLIGLIIVKTNDIRQNAEPPPPPPLDSPVRREPSKFPSNTHFPLGNEGRISGSIDLATFDPENDLISLYDSRVWWESDNDNNDDEDDHIINRVMERPLKRLIELVCQKNGLLEIHDSYRPTGIHNPKSLHKEGRAIDVTCDDFPLETLAKLCWAAGFDWVFYERKGGAHVHCSVRRDHIDELHIEDITTSTR